MDLESARTERWLEEPAQHDARHAAKVERIARQLRHRTSTRPLSLKKKTPPHQVPKRNDQRRNDEKIDLSDLDQILEIDPVDRVARSARLGSEESHSRPTE